MDGEHADALHVAREESATAAREMAEAAVADGARGCARMANLGAAGKYASNIERDLHRMSGKAVGAKISLYPVMTHKRARGSLAEQNAVHEVLLPHEFSASCGRRAETCFTKSWALTNVLNTGSV